MQINRNKELDFTQPNSAEFSQIEQSSRLPYRHAKTLKTTKYRSPAISFCYLVIYSICECNIVPYIRIVVIIVMYEITMNGWDSCKCQNTFAAIVAAFSLCIVIGIAMPVASVLRAVVLSSSTCCKLFIFGMVWKVGDFCASYKYPTI